MIFYFQLSTIEFQLLKVCARERDRQKYLENKKIYEKI